MDYLVAASAARAEGPAYVWLLAAIVVIIIITWLFAMATRR